jgi:pantoate--beta-alanine ligase
LETAREAMLQFEVEPEYLALVDPGTLEPVTQLDEPALLAVAAHVGATRLIDNLILEPPAVPIPTLHPGKAMTTCSA